MYHLFSIFSRLVPFPQVFGQVKEWLMLDLHEMIRLLHVVACPVVSILVSDRDGQARVFKVMRMIIF